MWKNQKCVYSSADFFGSGGGNNGGSGSGNSLVIGSTVPITNGTGTLTFTGG